MNVPFLKVRTAESSYFVVSKYPNSRALKLKFFKNFLSANFAPTIVPEWAHKLRKSRARPGTPSDRAMGYPPGSVEKSIKVYSCGSWAVLVASWGRLGAILGASWGVLGSSWGPFWDVLRRLGRIFFGLRCDFGWFWMDGLLTSFESMLARCLGMLRLSSRFAGFRRVSAERFPRCASTASRE